MRRFLFILLLIACFPSFLLAQAKTDTSAVHSHQEVPDSVVVSLITCSPGTLVYELYGHTALRVREVGAYRTSDWVFNYGTFSFAQPHFVWRFMLGQTDYQLGVLPYAYFYEEYVRSGRAIEEQRLNLTPEEEKKLVDALSTNLLPEHATYRYNFFYDNCTTRAINQIENAVKGKVEWGNCDSTQTLRDIVREYSASSPWNCFGQDLLLGSEADQPASLAKQMFAPLYAQRFVADAKIVSADGTSRQLAAPVVTLLPAQHSAKANSYFTPLIVFTTLLVLGIALSLYEWKCKKSYWQWDALLLLVQGLVGCLITFLFFFSAHPAVSSNWLLLLFNPLPLLYFPWFMKQASLRQPTKGMYVQLGMLTLTLLVGLLGWQVFPFEVYLIIALLAVRAVLRVKC